MKRVALILVLALLVFCLRINTVQPLALASASVSFQTVQNDQNGTGNNSTATDNGTSSNVTQPLTSNEIDIDRTYYVPTTITLNFPSTTATSLSNVSTVSGSGFNYAGDDKTFTFIAKTIDVYSFSFTINYANASSHSILIATWEGDRAMAGETWTAVASTYVVSFRLSMVSEPSYPSKEEVAQEALYQFQGMLQLLISNTQESANVASAMSETNSFICIISVIASFASLIVAARFVNKFQTVLKQEHPSKQE
jgi:hypothetical protein